MSRGALAGLGIGLAAVGALFAMWARATYMDAKYGGTLSAAMYGAGLSQAESAGMAAGLQAAVLPIVLAALTLLSGIAFLIAAAVRRS